MNLESRSAYAVRLAFLESQRAHQAPRSPLPAGQPISAATTKHLGHMSSASAANIFSPRTNFAAYGGKDLPLADYAALVAMYGTLVAGLITATGGSPRRLQLQELALLAISTYQLSRLVSKDRATAPFRAPFVKFIKDEGKGEVEEAARGQGMQRAIGDLVTSPFSLSPWIALLLLATQLLAPRVARMLCSLLTAIAVSHFLHQQL